MPSFSLEDLQVYQKALTAAVAISAVADLPAFDCGWELRRQLRSSSGRIPAHIAEGHGQKTDAHFAHYLYIARGSANEVRAHLRVGQMRGYISAELCAAQCSVYVDIGRMLTGLIRHLEREDRKERHTDY